MREFIGRFERRYHVVALKRRRASEREREESSIDMYNNDVGKRFMK